MKKIITLLLVLVLSFSLFAGCKKKNKDSKPSSEPNTSESTPESGNPGQGSLPEGSVSNSDLAGALSTQFSDVSSVKVEIDFTLNVEEDEWWYDGENYNNENEYIDGVATVTAIISKDENGLDAKVSVVSKSRSDKDSEYIEAPEMDLLYVIDNNLYVQSGGAFVIQNEPTQILNQLEGLLSGDILTTEETNALYNAIGEYVNVVFDVKNYIGSFSVDLKPVYTDLVTYIDGIDLETKTVKDIANDVLKLVDETLTIDTILNKVKTYAGLTVNQALAQIDQELTAEYQTTLQGIYDSLVADDRFVSAIVAMTTAANSEMSADEIDALVAQMKSAKIADLFNLEEIGDMVVFDVLMAMMGESENAPTKDEFFQMVDAMLAMTLADFEAQMEVVVFSSLKAIPSMITVNALDAKVDVEFTNGFAIETLTYDVNVDVETILPSEKEGENDETKVKFDLTIKVSDISKTPVEITKPTGVEFYDENPQGEWKVVGHDLIDEIDIQNSYLYFYIYLENGETLSVDYSCDTTAKLGYSFTLDKEDVIITTVFTDTEFEVTEDIVIVLDPVTGTATIQMQDTFVEIA